MKRLLRILTAAMLALSLLLACMSCSLLNRDKDTNTDSNNKTWENDALKIRFEYFGDATIAVTPGEDGLVTISWGTNVKITLRVEPYSGSNSDFKEDVAARFESMKDNVNDFEELEKKFYKINGCEAATIEYNWNVLGQDLRMFELHALKGGMEYSLLCALPRSLEEQYITRIRTVYKTFAFLTGEPDLQALSEEDGATPGASGSATPDTSTPAPTVEDADATGTPAGDTGGGVTPLTKYPYGITKSACGENETESAIEAEYAGDGRIIADWSILKEQYGEMLPAVLADMGLGDQQALWVTLGGAPFDESGVRHYFIQRFDSGAPADFLVYDSIGNIYLGSWYDIKLPVLVYQSN